MNVRSGDQWEARNRLAGLRRFSIAITVLNILGHTMLGFEQSWAQPIVSLAVAYLAELFLESIDALAQRRRLCFLGGGFGRFVDFMLPAHITGLAVGMLLYPNENLSVLVFASATAIASKAILRARVNPSGGRRHFFNPSNFGLSTTLLLFPWVGQVQPYHFTEELGHVGGWVLPGVIVCTGTFLNMRFTKRLWVIGAWVGGFAVQALIRALVLKTPFWAGFATMTGVPFMLYTFYMITDPATTPRDSRSQIAFGAGVATVYSILVYLQIVFDLFFALSIVCAVRGCYLIAIGLLAPRRLIEDQQAMAHQCTPALAVGALAPAPVGMGGSA